MIEIKLRLSNSDNQTKPIFLFCVFVSIFFSKTVLFPSYPNLDLPLCFIL